MVDKIFKIATKVVVVAFIAQSLGIINLSKMLPQLGSANQA